MAYKSSQHTNSSPQSKSFQPYPGGNGGRLKKAPVESIRLSSYFQKAHKH